MQRPVGLREDILMGNGVIKQLTQIVMFMRMDNGIEMNNDFPIFSQVPHLMIDIPWIP